jgi:hypothetical protein
LADKKYLYTLSQRSNTGVQGFRLYDLMNLCKKEKDFSYLLTENVYVGCQGQMDFSHENERLVFQQSFDNLMIIPLLHRNT